LQHRQGGNKKAITVRSGDDLYKLSNQREIYNDGFIIDEVDAGNGTISLTNGITLLVGESQGGLNDQVMKFMIRKTLKSI
jgi:type III restriction enzyme